VWYDPPALYREEVQMIRRILIALVLVGMASLMVSEAAMSEAAPDAPSGLTTEEQTVLEAMIEQVNVTEAVEEPGAPVEEGDVAPEVELGLEPVVVPDSVNVTLDTVWEKSPDDMSILDRLVKGVLRARTLPSEKDKDGKKKPPKFYWENGGVPIPEEEMVSLATEWAATFLAALEEVKKHTGIQLPLWGSFATLANEGGFYGCGLNYEARLWASKHSCKKLTTETWHGRTVTRKIETKLVKKFQQTYTCEEVWDIIHDPHYKDAKVQVKGRDGKMKWVKLANKADGGPWQQRFSVKTMTRERFDRLMSMQPGVYIGAEEMARRSISYEARFKAKEPHPRPWMLWPGWDPFTSRAISYDAKITMIARLLGARKDEIERGALVPNPVEKRRKDYEARKVQH
jgi:hypothetical protein